MDARIGLLVEPDLTLFTKAFDALEGRARGLGAKLGKEIDAGVGKGAAASAKHTKEMIGHGDQYKAAVMSQIKTVEEYRQQWAGKSAKALVQYEKELSDKRSDAETKRKQAYYDGDKVAQRIAENQKLRASEELRQLRQVSIERKEVLQGGAGALIGQLGIGRQIMQGLFAGPMGGSAMKFMDLGAKTEEISKVGPAFSGAAKGAAVAGVAILAVVEAIKLGIEAFHAIENAARKYEEGEDRLAIGLTRVLGLNKAQRKQELAYLSKDVDQLSDEFARPRNEIAETMATVTAFGRVGGANLKHLTELTIGVSEATGMATERVARFIGKGADPEFTAQLTRIGVAVKANSTQQERLNALDKAYGETIDETKERLGGGVHIYDRMTNAVSNVAGKFSLQIFKEIGPIFTKMKPEIEKFATFLGTFAAYEIEQGIKSLRTFYHIAQDTYKFIRMAGMAYGVGARSPEQIQKDEILAAEELRRETAQQRIDDQERERVESNIKTVDAEKKGKKTIEQINRNWYAKEKESRDRANADRLNTIRVAVNDEKITEVRAKLDELRANVDYNTELQKLTKDKKGLEHDYLEEVRAVALSESEIRRTVREERKRKIEEYKKLYSEGMQFIETVDSEAHATRLLALDHDYEQRILSEREYQHRLLEEQLRFAQERLKNAGGDDRLIAAAETKIHEAQHALAIQRMRDEDAVTKDISTARKEEQKKKLAGYKEVVSAGLDPFTQQLDKQVSLLTKQDSLLGNIFKHWLNFAKNKIIERLMSNMFREQGQVSMNLPTHGLRLPGGKMASSATAMTTPEKSGNPLIDALMLFSGGKKQGGASGGIADMFTSRTGSDGITLDEYGEGGTVRANKTTKGDGRTLIFAHAGETILPRSNSLPGTAGRSDSTSYSLEAAQAREEERRKAQERAEQKRKEHEYDVEMRRLDAENRAKEREDRAKGHENDATSSGGRVDLFKLAGAAGSGIMSPLTEIANIIAPGTEESLRKQMTGKDKLLRGAYTGGQYAPAAVAGGTTALEGASLLGKGHSVLEAMSYLKPEFGETAIHNVINKGSEAAGEGKTAKNMDKLAAATEKQTKASDGNSKALAGLGSAIPSLLSGLLGGASGGDIAGSLAKTALGFIPGGSILSALFRQGGVVNWQRARHGLLAGGTPGVDSIPILAQQGEGVINKEAVAHYGGAAFVGQVNSGSFGNNNEVTSVLQDIHSAIKQGPPPAILDQNRNRVSMNRNLREERRASF